MRRVIACFGLMAGCMAAADFPSTTISNGLIRAKVYLPDAKAGFYRASRFDWSGAIGSLEYKGTITTDRGSNASIPTSTILDTTVKT